MSNAGKMLFSLFMVVIMVSYVLFKSDVVVFDTKKDVYTSVIRASAQRATNEIMDLTDVNSSYDGNLKDIEDIPVDLDALYKFRQTMTRMLNSKEEGSLAGVNNINIPLAGFVTYRYVVGVTYGEDGLYTKEGNTFLLPMGYTMNVSSSGVPAQVNDTIWEFTLGDKIFIDGESYTGGGYILTHDLTGDTFDISSLLDDFKFEDIKDLKNYVVMDCIDRYLDKYSGASFNPIVSNTQEGLDFELGRSKYSKNKMDYTTKSSVIEGPGMFAIVDIYTGNEDEKKLYKRIASFGGAELAERTD